MSKLLDKTVQALVPTIRTAPNAQAQPNPWVPYYWPPFTTRHGYNSPPFTTGRRLQLAAATIRRRLQPAAVFGADMIIPHAPRGAPVFYFFHPWNLP